MSDVEFTGVSKRFGETQALVTFDLHVASGELVCLLGPSGCGKTTALRILAGFEQPDTGDVRVGGQSVVGTDPRARGLGIVFQSYSLFPNMSARRNIEFALGLKGVKGAEATRRVDELLEVTALGAHAAKYPHQLSGGQQQRVALARAIATRPPVLLLDEPLSALDAAVREQLRGEIRRLQRDLGITTVFVTHDQHEAMAIADRIGVMSAGSLVQLGPPSQVYTHPATSFVSEFLGTSNRLPVVTVSGGARSVLGVDVADDVDGAVVFVRPEHIRLSPVARAATQRATVREVSFLGPVTRVVCDLDGLGVVVDVASRDASALDIDHDVWLSLDGPVTAVVDA